MTFTTFLSFSTVYHFLSTSSFRNSLCIAYFFGSPFASLIAYRPPYTSTKTCSETAEAAAVLRATVSFSETHTTIPVYIPRHALYHPNNLGSAVLSPHDLYPLSSLSSLGCYRSRSFTVSFSLLHIFVHSLSRFLCLSFILVVTEPYGRSFRSYLFLSFCLSHLVL